MTRENAKKLQSMMAKEAVTLLMLGGAEADRGEKRPVRGDALIQVCKRKIHRYLFSNG